MNPAVGGAVRCSPSRSWREVVKSAPPPPSLSRPQPPVPSTSASADLKQSMKNFAVIDTAPDGNCFYSAFSYGLFHSYNAAACLRVLLQRHIYNHWSKFSNFSPLSRDAFFKLHSKSGVFATFLHIQAAADFTNTLIIVNTPEVAHSFEPTTPNLSIGPAVIYLNFVPPYGAGHFQCLLPPSAPPPLWCTYSFPTPPPSYPPLPPVAVHRPSDAATSEWFGVGRKGKKFPICAPKVTPPPPPPPPPSVSSAAPAVSACSKPLNHLAPEFIPQQKVSCSAANIEIVNLMRLDYKLFPVTVYVDGLKLQGHLDTAASRSLINSRLCTNIGALKPSNVLIQVANNNIMKCDGVYSPTLSFGSTFQIDHPILAADLSVDLILGDDFLHRVAANISYGTGTATFTFKGHSVDVQRLPNLPKPAQPYFPSPLAPSAAVAVEYSRLALIDITECHTSTLQVFSCPEVVVLAPHAFTTVPVHVNFPFPVLPAVLTPKLLFGTDYLYTMECFVSNSFEIPVYNGSDDQIDLPPNSKLGSIPFEDRNLPFSDFSYVDSTNLAQLLYRGSVSLESDQVLLSEECSSAAEVDRPALPSVSDCAISDAEKLQVQSLLENYSDVFGYELTPGSFVPNIFGHLTLKEPGNYFKRNWPWSLEQTRLANIQVDKLLKEDVIEETFTNNCLPVFVILKRGSTLENPVGRLLIDARVLNKKLHEYKFKQTTLDDCFQYCADKNLITVCDVVSYFHTIKLTPESTDLLGFQVGQRRFKFLRLPFGIKTAPQIAQSTMGAVLQALPVIHYVDDIVSAAKCFSDALSLFESILQRFRANNLLIRPDKTELFRRTVHLLGMKVTAGVCVQPDSSRFKPLLSLEYPRTPKQAKSVLCFLSYHRRFLSNFRLRTDHINKMACEQIPFVWTDSDRDLIRELYTHLLERATLALFNPTLPTKLHMDGSKIGIGGFLAQSRNHYYLPVAFFSKQLKPTQTLWSAYHIECLSLYECVRYFEKELLLLEKFTVVTDASSLKYLMQMQSPKSPFDLFISYLSKFTFDYELVRSERNNIPDALSRLPQPPAGTNIILPPNLTTYFKPPVSSDAKLLQVQTRAGKRNTASVTNPPPVTNDPDVSSAVLPVAPSVTPLPVTTPKIPEVPSTSSSNLFSPPDPAAVVTNDIFSNFPITSLTKVIRNFQRADPELRTLINSLSSNSNKRNVPKFQLLHGLLVTNTKYPRTVIPTKLVPFVLNEFHDLCMHSGIRIMEISVSKFYFWPNMYSDISTYVNSCVLCGEFKPTNQQFGLLQPRQIPANIFTDVMIDYCHVFTNTARNGFSQCLIVCDMYSNFCALFPCKSTDSADLIKHLKSFFSLYGVPSKLYSDVCSATKCAQFTEFATTLNFQVEFAASGAHWSVGAVESSVKRFSTTLKFLLNGKLSRTRQWHLLLPVIAFHMNNSPQISTKLSPNEIVFGRRLQTPFMNKSLLPVKIPIMRRLTLLREIRSAATVSKVKAKADFKATYDQNRKSATFRKNEQVLVGFERKATKLSPIKLQKRYRVGIVSRKVSPVLYVVKFKTRAGRTWNRLCHVAHMKHMCTRPSRLEVPNDFVF